MWLTNLRLVTPEGVREPGSLRIEQGRIVEVVEGLVKGALDCRGLTAIPGIVDLHGDMLEREVSPRPGMEFPEEVALVQLDKRLAANGVVTAFAAISMAEGAGLRSEARALRLIEWVLKLRPRFLTDMRIHVRYEITNMDTGQSLADLLERGAVHLLSFTDHSPGQGQFRDPESFARYYTQWLGVDFHVALGIAKEKEVLAKAEETWETVRRLADKAREKGVPMASHDDDTEARVQSMAGLGVSISEFPITLEAAKAAKGLGLGVVMGAPNAFRGGSHLGNLSARRALAEGVLDALASDYHPATLLLGAYKLAEDGGLPLHRAIGLVTEGPARLVGLTDRGRLAPGYLADVVLVEEGAYPRVRATLREGRFIYLDADLFG